jgi:LacI family transcriptional regulator/LacI family repressor for deo operon, udp, cdd, tsx, nupC, and nupG
LVTRKEVAERAGVSVATVSNVLSKKVYVLPETVEKVERAVRELKYVPNFTARSLSLGHAYQIGIAVSECTNPYHMEVFEAISDYSLKRGFMVTLFSMNSRFNNAMNFLTERQFDAFINFSNQEFAEDVVELLIRKKTILVNFPQTGLSFSFDYYDAMQEVMEKVCELGHDKVGYVSTMDSLRFAVDRRGMAFYDHRARLGFGEDDDYIVFNDDYSSPSEAVGYRKTKELFARKNDITAIFVTNDLAAIGAIRALKDMGLRVPEDVSVIGCDGLSLGEYCDPRLTTLWFDKTEHGKIIASHVIDKILSGSTEYDPPLMVKGKVLYRNSLAARTKKS